MMRFVKKAIWYRHRLAAMSFPEAIYRLHVVAKRIIDRLHEGKLIPHACDHGHLPSLPGLREGIDGWNVPQQVVAEWQDTERQAQTGKFFLLGQEWPECLMDRRWHLDPVTGRYWPHDVFCYALDYRHDAEMGDVKYVWELNRLQFLQPMAALAFKRKDQQLAETCLRHLESWIDTNPPFMGVNWSSGIELAVRIVSILVVVTLTNEYLTEPLRKKLWATLETHGIWLERYPSKYSSANNHRAAEGLGLFILGTLCPQFAAAARWKKLGWEILCEAAREQILPDGVGAEQAISYTAFLLEMLLLGYHIARSQNIAIPDECMRRLQAAGEYLRWFTDRSGHQPRIGDDDNACILGGYRRNEAYVSSVLGCLSSFLKSPDLTPPELQPHFRQTLFGFAPTSNISPLGVRCFENGGYTVGRHRFVKDGSEHEIMLAMDHGQLGYLSIAAHGHADALSLWLHIDGQPVLVDAGIYLYHSGGQWRQYFRGTGAHNTLCIEKSDSSVISGAFNWSHKASTRLNSLDVQDNQWTIEAEHDGYFRRYGVIHSRTVTVIPTSGFVVEDRLVGQVARNVTANYLVHPDCQVTEQDGKILILKNGNPLLYLLNEGLLKASIASPMTKEGGWYSPTFGVKIPTSRICYEGRLADGQKSVVRFSFTG